MHDKYISVGGAAESHYNTAEILLTSSLSVPDMNLTVAIEDENILKRLLIELTFAHILKRDAFLWTFVFEALK